MKLIDTVATVDRLVRLINSDTVTPVPVGFKIQANINALSAFVKQYQEQRNDIIKKYADDNGEVKEDSPNHDVCASELVQLDSTEIDLPPLQKVAVEDIENLSVPAYAIPALEIMQDDNKEV